MSTKGIKSSLPGTTWVAKLHKWRAKITFNEKTIHLGYFNFEQDAHETFKNKYKELYYKNYE